MFVDLFHTSEAPPQLPLQPGGSKRYPMQGEPRFLPSTYDKQIDGAIERFKLPSRDMTDGTKLSNHLDGAKQLLEDVGVFQYTTVQTQKLRILVSLYALKLRDFRAVMIKETLQKYKKLTDGNLQVEDVLRIENELVNGNVSAPGNVASRGNVTSDGNVAGIENVARVEGRRGLGWNPLLFAIVFAFVVKAMLGW